MHEGSTAVLVIGEPAIERNHEMTKNLHCLIDSVEEKTEDSNKGRRQPQQTLKMITTLPAFPVLNYCTLHQLLPHTIHCTYSPESHPYPHIAYLTLPQFFLSSEANHHACTHMDHHTVDHSCPPHLTPFITYVLANPNPHQYASHMYLPCIDPAPLATHCIYPIFTILTHMSPIRCTHPSNVCISSIPCIYAPHTLFTHLALVHTSSTETHCF